MSDTPITDAKAFEAGKFHTVIGEFIEAEECRKIEKRLSDATQCLQEHQRYLDRSLCGCVFANEAGDRDICGRCLAMENVEQCLERITKP